MHVLHTQIRTSGHPRQNSVSAHLSSKLTCQPRDQAHVSGCGIGVQQLRGTKAGFWQCRVFKTGREAQTSDGTVARTLQGKPQNGRQEGIVDCSIRVAGTVEAADLNIQVKDANTGDISDPINFSKWDTTLWDRSATGDGPGSILSGRLSIGGVTSPGAVLISYDGPQDDNKDIRAKQLSRVFIADITMKDAAFGKAPVVFTVRSFVNAVHTEVYGPRIFFTNEARLPNDTPTALRADRKLDLDIIKGEDRDGKKIAGNPRVPADRIEDYDVYNDLGSKMSARPVLGDPAGMDGLPYPRRLRTNRGLNADNKTELPATKGRWVPADEDFDVTKDGQFKKTTTLNAIPLVISQLTVASKRLGVVGVSLGWVAALLSAVYALFRFGRKPTAGASSGIIGGFWSSFDEVVDIYDNERPVARIIDEAEIGRTNDAGPHADLSEAGKDAQTRAAINKLPADQKALVLGRAGISLQDFEATERVVPMEKWQNIRRQVNSQLSWPEPLVYKGQHTTPNATDYDGDIRAASWTTDEEFGRQYKAGSNPFVLAAMKSLPAGDSILGRDNAGHINRQLEGNTLEGLMSEVNSGSAPRIFIVDYEKHIADCAVKVNTSQEDRCLYAGRCVLYQRNDKYLVPVAIELHAPSTSASKRVLYTPEDPSQVWQLAKASFNSIDSGVHQLISHWLRTHACVEPYCIATHRNLSQMHPLFKLLQPHLQFTYRINADARSVLIAANTVVELVFTPGSESMALSAQVYKDWQFKDQAFPQDVLNRGLAKQTRGGGIEIIAEDHPWCEDGLLIWDALYKYISNYVAIYYKSDEDVKRDTEVTAWWNEIREKGHPDVNPAGWPSMETRAELSHILCTIAWTTSAHHAAVNFGQADYSSFPLNRTSLLRKPIPEKGSKAYKALANPEKFETEFLRYIGNQLPASITIAVMEILSTHSENEHYLTDADQKFISGKAALSVHAQLLQDLAAAEETIAKRNTGGKSKSRTVSAGGLPYQLLIPSGIDSEGKPLPSETTAGQRVANRPGRGIPFSISI